MYFFLYLLTSFLHPFLPCLLVPSGGRNIVRWAGHEEGGKWGVMERGKEGEGVGRKQLKKEINTDWIKGGKKVNIEGIEGRKEERTNVKGLEGNKWGKWEGKGHRRKETMMELPVEKYEKKEVRKFVRKRETERSNERRKEKDEEGKGGRQRKSIAIEFDDLSLKYWRWSALGEQDDVAAFHTVQTEKNITNFLYPCFYHFFTIHHPSEYVWSCIADAAAVISVWLRCATFNSTSRGAFPVKSTRSECISPTVAKMLKATLSQIFNFDLLYVCLYSSSVKWTVFNLQPQHRYYFLQMYSILYDYELH